MKLFLRRLCSAKRTRGDRPKSGSFHWNTGLIKIQRTGKLSLNRASRSEWWKRPQLSDIRKAVVTEVEARLPRRCVYTPSMRYFVSDKYSNWGNVMETPILPCITEQSGRLRVATSSSPSSTIASTATRFGRCRCLHGLTGSKFDTRRIFRGGRLAVPASARRFEPPMIVRPLHRDSSCASDILNLDSIDAAQAASWAFI
jgi:hypothetical protein